jgi:hypothetical protein
VLGEVVHPQNFNTMRRIAEEDGRVVEEQEQFVELVSSEFMLQTLKGLLDDQKRQMLEDLPDGIHSGLTRGGAKGVFFYFQAEDKRKQPAGGQAPGPGASKQHFWRYIELGENPRGGQVEDNRYVITNLIQCQPDTPRVVPAPGEVDIFSLQEKVIASIVQSSIEQVAVEEAPKLLDPIQQTIATTLRGYINSPQVSRKEIIGAIQKLTEPQPSVYIKALRKAYEDFTVGGNLVELLAAVNTLEISGSPTSTSASTDPEAEAGGGKSPVRREDLRLICFDYVW